MSSDTLNQLTTNQHTCGSLVADKSLDVEKQAHVHSVIVLIEEIVGASVQQYL